MSERVYENTREILKLYPVKEYLVANAEESFSFKGNDYTDLFFKLLNVDLIPKKGFNDLSDAMLKKAAKHVDCLSDIERRSFYISLITKIYSKNDGFISDAGLKILKTYESLLNLNPAFVNQVRTFYNCNSLFDDFNEAVYFTSIKDNRIKSAYGINVVYNLSSLNETVYFKYLREYNLILFKKFRKHRSNNSLSETNQVFEIGVLYDDDLFTDSNNVYSYFSIIRVINDFFPYRTFEIKATECTPFIALNAEHDEIRISGSSTPLSPMDYFEPLYYWLDLFNKYGSERLCVHLNFEYYNTYTSKFLLRFIHKCKEIIAQDKSVEINWYYESDDDDLKDHGFQLQKIFGNHFNVISLNEDFSYSL